ncbi:dual specificity protein kinase monopolar spindle 1 isoform 2-T2 [Cochliomyia hominivorax]
MSFHFPRRVKDLPKLELDSEDEFNTPCKEKNDRLLQQKSCGSDKENNEKCNHGSTSSFNGLRMLPKRRAELPTLESDSEEEDSVKKDNLNCAILNDSFLVSPGKSDRDDISSKESSAVKGNSNNSTNDMSLLAHFNNMGIKSPTKEKILPLKQIPTDSIDQRNAQVDRNVLASNTKNLNTTVDSQFATPQIRSFSVQRRPRDLCSTQSQKNKSAIVNEFRTQKVLFQTPMAISRAPIMQNDSISISLCDTINECGTPSTAEKTPHCVNEKPLKDTGRSKKSLEGAFIEASKDRKEESRDDASKNSQVITTKDKTTIVNINKSNYIIIQKLGCGGSSSVYQAKREDNGKECALKVVDLQGDPAVVEGYLNETKLLAKLQGNVCVVALYEYQLLQKESKLFLVMEKGDSDLHKILQSYTTNLPLYVLTNFLYQMLQAVNYIHQNGVIHSDLKPANFLMVNGRLKLIDFGIASPIAIDSTSIIKFSQAGTFNYISPEALTDTSTGSSPMRSNQPKIKMAKNCLQHNPKQRPSCADLLKYPFNMIIPIQNLSLPSK